MRKALLLALVLVIFPILMPTVNAYYDSMHIFLFVGNSEDDYYYNIGDSVPVEVLVFDKGQLTDADTEPIITMNEYLQNQRDFTLQKTGLGKYTGRLNITSNDVYFDYIDLHTEATLGRENDSDLNYDDDEEGDWISVIEEDGFDVNLEFDHTKSSFISATSGDTIHIKVFVENNSVGINPDSLSLTANDKALEYTNPSIGVFLADYTISQTLSEVQYICINAEAEYNNETDEDEGYVSINFRNLWYHMINVDETLAEFELYVSDDEREPFEGANISFNYEIDDNDVDEYSPSKFQITDSGGRTFFSIEYDSASYIQIVGSVKFSGMIQNFQNAIHVSYSDSDIEEPSPYEEFQVIYQENLDRILPNKTVSLDYIAYKQENTLSDQLIYYYLYTDNYFIKSGYTTTDSKGSFSFNFTVPDAKDNIWVIFESPFNKESSWEHTDCDDDFVYKEDLDYISVDIESEDEYEPDKSIEIVLDEFEVGGKIKIKAQRPNSEDYFVDLDFVVGNYTIEDIYSDFNPKWSKWASAIPYPSSFDDPILKDGNFTWEFNVEEFLPKDETYTIIVTFRDPNDPFIGYYWNIIHVTPEAEVKEGDDKSNDLSRFPFNIGDIGMLFIIIIIAILVAVIIAILQRNSSKIKPKISNEKRSSNTETTFSQENELYQHPNDEK
jgi:hypothetical protein